MSSEVSKRANERMSQAERASESYITERAVRSKQMLERRKRTRERRSEWPSAQRVDFKVMAVMRKSVNFSCHV